MIKAKKKPPKQKNTSTDSSPASNTSIKGLFAKVVKLPIFSMTGNQNEKTCPITTHIIASDRTPSQMLRG